MESKEEGTRIERRKERKEKVKTRNKWILSRESKCINTKKGKRGGGGEKKY